MIICEDIRRWTDGEPRDGMMNVCTGCTQLDSVADGNERRRGRTKAEIETLYRRFSS